MSVALATDNDYVIPTYMAVFSLLYNHSGSRKVHIYLLVPGDYSEENKMIFHQIEDVFKKATFSFINMGNAYCTVEMNWEYLGTPTMYRLLLPEILEEVDKCIYLDSDLIVEKDIEELFDIDIRGFFVAGVMNSFRDSEESRRKQLQIPTMDKYINAGVLLLNLNEIRISKLCQKLESRGLDESLLYHDQDAINSVLYDKIMVIPPKYNMRVCFFYVRGKKQCGSIGKEGMTEARKKPVIIHYTGEKKPWAFPNMYDSRYWMKYANMQPLSFKRDYLNPYLEKHKGVIRGSASDVIIEYAKEALKRMGLYGYLRSACYSLIR